MTRRSSRTPEQLTTQSTRLSQAFRKELLAGFRLSTYARYIAMQLRVPIFLYFFILMASAILSYSPRLVLWNGLTTAAVWSAGVWWVVAQPENTTLLTTGNASPGVYEN